MQRCSDSLNRNSRKGDITTFKLFFGVALLLILPGLLRAQKATVDCDKAATFTGYKTYAWGEGTPVKNQLMHQRILDGVDKQLAAKEFPPPPAKK